MEGLVIRLDRLERENHRLKRVGAVALAGIAALVLMAQATPGEVAKVVESKQFVLKDSSTLATPAGSPPQRAFHSAGGA